MAAAKLEELQLSAMRYDSYCKAISLILLFALNQLLPSFAPTAGDQRGAAGDDGGAGGSQQGE